MNLSFCNKQPKEKRTGHGRTLCGHHAPSFYDKLNNDKIIDIEIIVVAGKIYYDMIYYIDVRGLLCNNLHNTGGF